MTSREFIGKCVRGDIRKNRILSSIVFNAGLETIYSYGSHYPLLFKINGKWILNDRGYSSTTSKHISWASQYADYRVSLADGNGSYNYRAVEPTAANTLQSAMKESAELFDKIGKMTPRATVARPQAEARRAELARTINFLREEVDPDDKPF